MKKLIIILSLFLSIFSSAQNNELTDFKFISYDIDSENNVTINSYSSIDKNGLLNVYMEENEIPTYYSYKLSTDELDKIKKVFNNNLHDYIEKKELGPNTFYAGNRNYITSTINKKTKKICFIEPFMKVEFNEIISLLNEKNYLQDDSAKTSKFKINFKSIKKEIILQNQIDNYLPEKKLPPPMIIMD